MRLFVDETISFGTLGSSGKGVTEHFGVTVSGQCIGETRDINFAAN